MNEVLANPFLREFMLSILHTKAPLSTFIEGTSLIMHTAHWDLKRHYHLCLHLID